MSESEPPTAEGNPRNIEPNAPQSLLTVLATLTPLEEELLQVVDLPPDDVSL
jgi:hypothetical protein